ncbi:MAG: hypothetical protein EOP24_25855 [Hyphomicrobiales bacterium]|nr:MAG: hypothetical protein EOP24_25855 [Hyphomicrobiales bacterium]
MPQPTALVIGGTGPTGPYVIDGLLARGFKVTMLNRGLHDSFMVPAEVDRLHADAFSIDTVADALGSRTFDLGLVMYGRLREIARLLVGRVGQLVTVGGNVVYEGYGTPTNLRPVGLPVPAREDIALSSTVPGPTTNTKIARIVETEQVVFETHPTAAHFRYPQIYGPRQLIPREWMIVRRILDGRRRIILPDGGHTLRAAAFCQNAAATLLSGVDQPEKAAGQAFNVSDDWTPTLRQVVEMIADAMDVTVEVAGMPHAIATPARPFLVYADEFHRHTPNDKARYTLGHVNPVTVQDGVRQTVDWLLKNRPDDAAFSTQSGDPFNYAAEDALLAHWDSLIETARPTAEAADPGYVDRYNAAFDATGRPQQWVLTTRPPVEAPEESR